MSTSVLIAHGMDRYCIYVYNASINIDGAAHTLSI